MKIWWKISYFVDKKKNSVRERSLFFLDFPKYLIFLSYFLISLCLHIKLKVYGHIYTIYRASEPFQKSLSNWESQVYFLLMVLIPLSILNLGMIIRLKKCIILRKKNPRFVRMTRETTRTTCVRPRTTCRRHRMREFGLKSRKIIWGGCKLWKKTLCGSYGNILFLFFGLRKKLEGLKKNLWGEQRQHFILWCAVRGAGGAPSSSVLLKPVLERPREAENDREESEWNINI